VIEVTTRDQAIAEQRYALLRGDLNALLGEGAQRYACSSSMTPTGASYVRIILATGVHGMGVGLRYGAATGDGDGHGKQTLEVLE
jgi:hypothetical protein